MKTMTIEQTTTLTINVRDSGALALLRDMERLNLIHVSSSSQGQPDCGMRGGLAARFAGALRLSDARYEEMQAALREGREEWNRGIF